MDQISFGTDGWRDTLDRFTDRRVRIVGQAVADTLAETEADATARPVIVGYDARPTSEGFAESLAEVLTGNGFDALVPERDRPTPLVAHAVVERDAAGALMVTASHNPPEYNGVKFIPSDGAPALPDVTERIEANLREPALDAAGTEREGAVRRVDLATPHAERARELVGGEGGVDLSGLTVAYDAMHGSGRGVTDALLESAGAEVERIRCERDPEFGGGSPEPSAGNLGELTARVRDGDADLGIANDGDADRLAVVTPERGHLDENLLFAATYDHLLDERSGPAVRTVSTTFLIDRIAEAHGEEVYETAVGFKWVARAMDEHDALVGGEESGGFSVRGHVREKDGVLMALLAAAAERGPDAEKERVVAELADHIPDEVAGEEVADVVTVDGFKLLLSDGSWMLVRPSGTEPKMRVYAESDSEADTAAILAAGRELVAPLV
ncbi:phosphoglucomutase [Halobacteriales archaeon QS_6_71_20]|nr:MAG: phosphoglucomutase [Halobacteriales archaeon QS_6_71_20]